MCEKLVFYRLCSIIEFEQECKNYGEFGFPDDGFFQVDDHVKDVFIVIGISTFNQYSKMAALQTSWRI